MRVPHKPNVHALSLSCPSRLFGLLLHSARRKEAGRHTQQTLSLGDQARPVEHGNQSRGKRERNVLRPGDR